MGRKDQHHGQGWNGNKSVQEQPFNSAPAPKDMTMKAENQIRQRTCCYCGRRLPLTSFGLKPGSRSVRYKACNECRAVGHSCLKKERPRRGPKPLLDPEERKRRAAESKRRWRENNKERMREYYHAYYERKKAEKQTETCVVCGRELPLSMFRDSNGRRRNDCKCKDCREANRRKPRTSNGNGKRHDYAHKYYEEHKEQIKEQQALHLATLPPVPKQPKEQRQQMCRTCEKWPCFEGIETLESDFAKEGCISFRRK